MARMNVEKKHAAAQLKSILCRSGEIECALKKHRLEIIIILMNSH